MLQENRTNGNSLMIILIINDTLHRIENHGIILVCMLLFRIGSCISFLKCYVNSCRYVISSTRILHLASPSSILRLSQASLVNQFMMTGI